MTSLERVLKTLRHEEPDRVPVFLLLTMHGAKELGMSIEEYFSRGEHVAEGQRRLQRKYGNDCYYAFFYAPIEIEAWGGSVIYREDGPPNSGAPLIKSPEKIQQLKAPAVEGNPVLGKVLECIKRLKATGDEGVPIIGVVMSPFSLPVMQMGFEPYLLLMHEQPEIFERLMEINTAFTIAWANAQLEAGATAITYFDPVSSPTIIPRDLFLQTGLKVAQNTLSKIKGPTAVHLASGNALGIIDDMAGLGAPILGVSAMENLTELKARSDGRLTLLGNLNGIEMCRWTQEEAAHAVRVAIDSAAAGGGFILSDNHGEIPFQVPDETIMTIAETARSYGKYPLQTS